MPEREWRLLRPVWVVAGPEPSAPLQYTDPQALFCQSTGGYSPTKPGAHDHHVVCAFHSPFLSPTPWARHAIP
jgi:hypothetical protein